MKFVVINTDTAHEHSFWNSFDRAKSECDAAKKLYDVPFTVEKREIVWSSETVPDDLSDIPLNNFI